MREAAPAVPISIRAVTARDRPLVAQGLGGLGKVSLYYRFGRVAVAEAQALEWLSQLDHDARFAVGACHAETSEPLGVARYVRSLREPDDAEIAVAVVDAWQGRRVGTRLLAALVPHARASGIRAIQALIVAENRRAVRLMRAIGGRRVGGGFGMVEMRATIDAP
jgi:RimJ/RimL family protein N-acetyltransferase